MSEFTEGWRYSGSAHVDLYITGEAAQTAQHQNILLPTAGTAPIDTLGYRSWSIQIVPAGTIAGGVITFEGSNELNGTYSVINVWDIVNSAYTQPATSQVTLATGVSRIYGGPLQLRYIRARISTAVSGAGGSVAAFTVLRTTPFSMFQSSVDITKILSNTVTAGAGQVSSGSIRIAQGGQCSNHRWISTADTNSANIKSSAGTLWSVQASNINAAIRYLKLYDKATAPTVGTDTPICVIPLPASGAPVNIVFPQGLNFTLGLGRGIVTGILDNSTAATAASEQVVSIQYT
jgi:hypothetical protein